MQICKTLDKLVILLIVIVASTFAGLFRSVQEIKHKLGKRYVQNIKHS